MEGAGTGMAAVAGQRRLLHARTLLLVALIALFGALTVEQCARARGLHVHGRRKRRQRRARPEGPHPPRRRRDQSADEPRGHLELGHDRLLRRQHRRRVRDVRQRRQRFHRLRGLRDDQPGPRCAGGNKSEGLHVWRRQGRPLYDADIPDPQPDLDLHRGDHRHPTVPGGREHAQRHHRHLHDSDVRCRRHDRAHGQHVLVPLGQPELRSVGLRADHQGRIPPDREERVAQRRRRPVQLLPGRRR